MRGLEDWRLISGKHIPQSPDVINNKKKQVLIVAGEASGDSHGANLVLAIRELAPGTSFRGIGGSKMEEAGVDILVNSSDMAVVGLTEVFSRLYSILKARHNLIRLLKNSRPDLLILIDYPDFNINLARAAKGLGVPVLYYISPQIWAWRSGRVKKIARRVDRMAVILPFEKEFYLKDGIDIDVEYVGHPLLDAVPFPLEEEELRRDLGLGDARPILGLLPGSRTEEVRNLLPVMVYAAEIMSSHYPDMECLLPMAPTISPDLIVPIIHKTPLKIIISPLDIYRTLRVCDLALVASGTATLEAAIMEVPMVITYRVSSISYWIAKMVVEVPHAGLVNLIAGEEIVPELLQNEVTPVTLAETGLSILRDGHRRTDMIEGLRRVKAKLGRGGASLKTAKIALKMMKHYSNCGAKQSSIAP